MKHAKPSRTAVKIARFVLLLDALPELRAVLPAGAAATVEDILRGSEAVPARHIEMMRARWTRRFYGWMEALTGRGQLLWFGVRKRWLATQVEAAIAGGARQLLVIGAGFDPLAARMAAADHGLLCVEIDAPATADPKRRGVQAAGMLGANLHVCSADLAERPLAEVLGTTPWRADVPSVVVAEGLLMYLAPTDVVRLLEAVRGCTPPGSMLACSCVDADDRGRPDLGQLDAPIRWALRLAGEPMHWGIRPADVPAFVAPLGYRVRAQPTLAMLRADLLAPRGLRDAPLSPYEHLVALERV